jgi:membrane-associated protease RseP (regulator of RpoE activity)
MTSLTPFFQYWRSTLTRDREIVDAVVLPAHRGPSAELAAVLRQWPGIHYWVRGDGDGRLMLVRPLVPPVRERWWLHGVLFAATFLTTWMAGAVLAGVPPSWPAIRLADAGNAFRAVLDWLVLLRPGLEFAMAFLAILLAHETGHYLTAKRYGINSSPPYFLPFPPYFAPAPPLWNFVGTLGAFIRLRSPVADRQQLLDVGAAGPWAGFLVALIFLAAGLTVSQSVPALEAAAPQLIVIGGTPLYLGDSLVMALARRLFTEGGVVLLHPLALAGWLGLLVTTLNLLPLGQLDGGHVLYALVGRRQAWVALATWAALIVLGFWFWGWWVWALFTLVLGRGSLAHPAVLDRHRPITAGRRPFGWAGSLLFLVTFTPVPFHI